ncbi:MmgE/PrpD family protein [Pseudomonas lopnurensis]|uniref:MmgE/PrpD family protein n=1 Tax=Pseudomonas lopnurensis TaxID=1477517 RepID=UPI0028AB127A|nr:MmgE/PrpD family protein [Pseudomonas lopnurensis]
MTVIEVLAQQACAIAGQALPERTLHAAKRAVLDWFAATVPGTESALTASLKAALANELGEQGVLVLGDRRRAQPRQAALLNGTASHVAEFDDIFRDALYHPGSPIIAAALALGEAEQISGELLLKAVINGYELSTRIGTALQPEHYKHWHTTGTVGCFGAAAAAATILKLDETRFAHALGTVGTFAAGLQQAFRSDTMSKPLHAGRAAEAGVLAALLAKEGFTGALDILEGEVGYGVVAANGRADWAKATEGLGESFNIEQVTIKDHGCCGHTFAAIDGAKALKAAHGFVWQDIERITVRTYRTALDVVGRRSVSTPFEGRFSLRFTMASVLIHDRLRLDAFTPSRLADTDIRHVMAITELVVDDELDRLYPNKRGARVIIALKDGRTLERLQSHRRGDPEEPLSDEELMEKFEDLVVPSLGEEKAKALQQAIWQLETGRLAVLTDLLAEAYTCDPA